MIRSKGAGSTFFFSVISFEVLSVLCPDYFVMRSYPIKD